MRSLIEPAASRRSILDEIVERARADVATRQNEVPLEALRERAGRDVERRSLRHVLDLDGVGVIAEIKRASPTGGTLATNVDPAEWAALYEANGAVAISVLTNEPYFRGTLDDLEAARAACGVPVLRKEFIVSDYQIHEAAAAGADAVLLIVGLTPEQDLAADLALVQELGMEALVEVHVEEEIQQALFAGAHIIGINNRNLRSFKTDLAVTERLSLLIPDDITVVSESGVRTPADVHRLARAGVSGVLVGESIMSADDPGSQLREISEAGY